LHHNADYRDVVVAGRSFFAHASKTAKGGDSLELLMITGSFKTEGGPAPKDASRLCRRKKTWQFLSRESKKESTVKGGRGYAVAFLMIRSGVRAETENAISNSLGIS
jgi:hypothetical protein